MIRSTPSLRNSCPRRSAPRPVCGSMPTKETSRPSSRPSALDNLAAARKAMKVMPSTASMNNSGGPKDSSTGLTSGSTSANTSAPKMPPTQDEVMPRRGPVRPGRSGPSGGRRPRSRHPRHRPARRA